MEVTPEILLRAYRAGVFPMAPDRRSGDLEWYRPVMRGIIPLDGFHLPRRLARTALSGRFEVRSDTAFGRVLDGCAQSAPGRETTWISGRIQALYVALHEMGHAHSVEVWRGDDLVGGLYGVTLGGAFFGESMFSRATDASKIAFVHLVATMRRQGYVLLDAQYATAHLQRFGCIEVPAAMYDALLPAALSVDAVWSRDLGLGALGDEIRRFQRAGSGTGQAVSV